VPAAGAKSTAGTVACGGNGSAQRPRAILAQVVKLLERRGKPDRSRGVGSGGGQRSGPKVQRRGRRGRKQRRGDRALGGRRKGRHR
jgi:hypothetical protein